MPPHLIVDTHRWNPERDECPHCHKKPLDEVTSLWLEAPFDDEWLAALRVVVQDGLPVVAELRVFPDDGNDGDNRWPGSWSAERLGYLAPVPPGGLTARKLRRVLLETLLREQFKPLVAHYNAILRRHLASTGAPTQDARTLNSGGPKRSARPRRGRATSTSDLELARLAQEYLELCGDVPTAQHPTKALAASRPGWTPTYARDQLFAARERDLLTSHGRGRQGGTLTPKAEQLLREAATSDQHQEGKQ
jgi:hypothetical protein